MGCWDSPWQAFKEVLVDVPPSREKPRALERGGAEY